MDIKTEHLIGKTIASAGKVDLGDNDDIFRIHFTDGTALSIESGSSGDGSYLSTRLSSAPLSPGKPRRFYDGHGNMGELELCKDGRAVARLMHMGTSRTHVKMSSNGSVAMLRDDGRAPDTLYDFFAGTTEEAAAWLRENGFGSSWDGTGEIVV